MCCGSLQRLGNRFWQGCIQIDELFLYGIFGCLWDEELNVFVIFDHVEISFRSVDSRIYERHLGPLGFWW